MAQIDTADEAQQQPPRVHAEDLPEAVVDQVASFIGKPRARGWIHVYSAIVAFIAGAALVSVSWSRGVDARRACDAAVHLHDRRHVRASAAPITG